MICIAQGIIMSGKKNGSPFVDFTENIPDIYLNENEVIISAVKPLALAMGDIRRFFIFE